MKRRTGVTLKELMPLSELALGLMGEQLYRQPTVTLDLNHRGEEGVERSLEVQATLVKEDQRFLICASIRDITDRKKAQLRTQYFAYHDILTGLPNRLSFRDRLDSLIQKGGGAGAVLFLDLEGLKAINDRYSHDMADRLLQHVARRLTVSVRSDDMVARQSGGEFLVLMQFLQDNENIAQAVERLRTLLHEPIWVDGHELMVTATIGVTCFPEDGQDAATLVQNADMAMYKAREGKLGFSFYNRELRAQLEGRLESYARLRRAIENKEFILHYQPQFCVKTGRMVGMEAMVRWQTHEQGLVYPGSFIPLAEETGLIKAISDQVLLMACQQANIWKHAGLQAPRIAINLSAQQFQNGDVVEWVRRTLEMTGCDPSMIELEITESVAINNLNQAREVLLELKALGFELSLDDFGTGYSSLSTLHQLPFDRLKIDRSFLKDIGTSNEGVPVILSILNLAHQLNLEVVAEGIETVSQLTFLQQHGCHIAQGFGLCRPISADEITRSLVEGGVQSRMRILPPPLASVG